MGFPPFLNLSTRLFTAALPGQTTKTALTEEFMFQNVAYRPTVYRTGDGALAHWTTQPVFKVLIFSYITGPCQVIETGSNTLQPCVFPFVVDGRRFSECTTHLDPNQGQAHHMFPRFLNL